MNRARLIGILLRLAVAILGITVCYRLFQIAGFQQLAKAITEHWLALIILTATYAVFHVLRTWALMICIPRQTSFWEVFGIRLAGEAMAYAAVGSLLGDTAKVAIGRERIPVRESAIGVFAEKLIYYLSGIAFIAGGLVVAARRVQTSSYLVLTVCVLSAIFLALYGLLASGIRPIARLLKPLRVRNAALRQAVLEAEENLFDFRKRYPGKFFAAFFLDLLTYFFCVIQLYYLLPVLGVRASLLELWYYQAVIQIAGAGGIFIPA